MPLVLIPLQSGLILGCALLAVAGLVHVLANRPIGRVALTLAGLLEIGLLAQLVVGIVRLPGTEVDAVTFIGYLITCLLIVPAAVWWARGEPSRGGTAVLLLGAAVVAFLELRLAQIWGAGIGA